MKVNNYNYLLHYVRLADAGYLLASVRKRLLEGVAGNLHRRTRQIQGLEDAL